jgi:adenylosuccinate lyase
MHRDFSRGVAVDASGLGAFVDTLRIPEEDRARLRALTPATYIGRAKDLAEATKDAVDAIICI